MEQSMPVPPYRGFRGTIARFARARRTRAATLATLVAAVFGAISPAHAQIAGSVALQSNQIFRGESISGDDPGMTLAASMDGPGGFFAGADISLAAGGEEARITASSQYAGYAVRAGKLSIEAGAIHRHYRHRYDHAYGHDYFEFYAGATIRALQLRAYVSPDYLVDGRASYYVEANARLGQIAGWTIHGHGGLSLIPVYRSYPGYGLAAYEDWSLRASRPVGTFDLGIGLASTNYPVFGEHGRVRASVVVSRSF